MYCKLRLPENWKIHPEFNIRLLERYRGEVTESPEVEIEPEGEEWVMELIIASGPSDEDVKKHVFLVKWKDFTHEENAWESYENVMEHGRELLEAFYEKNAGMARDGRFENKKKKTIKLRRTKR